MTNVLPNPVEAERPRWRRRFVQYWWLWGFVLILVVVWGIQQWNQRLTPYEQKFVGTWRPVTNLQRTSLVLVNPDRTLEIWRIDGNGKAFLNESGRWKARPGEFCLLSKEPFSNYSWPTWQKAPIRTFDGQRIDFPTFYWQRMDTLPEPFASSRENWLQRGSNR